MSNYRYIDLHQDVKIEKLDLSEFCLIENPIKNISDNSISLNILNHNFSVDLDKLWSIRHQPDIVNFNINYLQFLSSSLSLQKKIFLLDNHINKAKSGDNTFIYDPAVISLKIPELIRFVSINSLNNGSYEKFIFDQTEFLYGRLEKELLGNHYIFNGMALLFSSYFFKNHRFLKKAIEILSYQLEEQFLDDGMHFELSPMYHAIIIVELLKCYDLQKNNNWKLDTTKSLLKNTLVNAMRFYDFISVDGLYPCFNDSYSINSYYCENLKSFFYDAGLNFKKLTQSSQSGYRKYLMKDLTLIFDAAQIGPRYQPGHSHADNLTFCLYNKKAPIIVDTGTSVYANNKRRFLERSTESHNTVQYGNINSSEVWSSFRVGKMAETNIEKEEERYISAFHNGYENLGVIHKRTIKITESEMIIKDNLNLDKSAKSFLHFHPDVKIVWDSKNKLVINNKILISFFNWEKIKIQSYMFSKEFNNLQESKKIVIQFKHNTKIIISLINE
tara:strand:+ start:16557 stop:18059 length:1503 start_codon:yes stop_codon:yes gene_type:complete